MAVRDNFFRKFGPLFLEAILEYLFENIMELRREQGMPEKTKDEFFLEIENHLSELVPYDWMTGGM